MKMKTGIAALLALCILAIGSVSFAGDLTEEFAAEVEVEKVNVNEADAETIAAALTGVGVSRAQAIVDYREQYGQFYSAEELTAVRGIGDSTVEKNLDKIRLK
jgi:competence protein ComEA